MINIDSVYSAGEAAREVLKTKYYVDDWTKLDECPDLAEEIDMDLLPEPMGFGIYDTENADVYYSPVSETAEWFTSNVTRINVSATTFSYSDQASLAEHILKISSNYANRFSNRPYVIMIITSVRDQTKYGFLAVGE